MAPDPPPNLSIPKLQAVAAVVFLVKPQAGLLSLAIGSPCHKGFCWDWYCLAFLKCNLGGGLKDFLFSPLFGEGSRIANEIGIV